MNLSNSKSEPFRSDFAELGKLGLGMEKGMEKGAQQTAEEIANRLIQKGMSHQDVQEMTQLSSDAIERLKNDS